MNNQIQHSIVSHFNWMPELFFTGLLFMMTNQLRTFSLLPEQHMFRLPENILILGSVIMTALSEWIFTMFTISTLCFQFYDFRNKHLDEQLLSKSTQSTERNPNTFTNPNVLPMTSTESFQKPMQDAFHENIHDILYGSLGQIMVSFLSIFAYALSTVHNVQYSAEVITKHPHIGNMIWGVNILLDVLFLTLTCGLVCMGWSSSTTPKPKQPARVQTPFESLI